MKEESKNLVENNKIEKKSKPIQDIKLLFLRDWNIGEKNRSEMLEWKALEVSKILWNRTE